MRVTAPSDDCADGGADAGCGHDDPLRVGVGVEVGHPLIDLFDLTGQKQRLVGLVGDVGGQLGEVHPIGALDIPQGEGFSGRGDQAGGMVVTPVARRAGDEEPGQPGLAEPDHRVRMA